MSFVWNCFRMHPLPHILALQLPGFAALVQQAVTPRLRGRPVVVVSSRQPLGRVVANSPQAEAAGVHEGMRYGLARAACPEGTFLLPDPDLESRAEAGILQAMWAYSPCLERYGPGRFFMDVRGTARLFGAPLDLAARLQRDLQQAWHLSGALGLAGRRIWSLLAGRLAAPGGVMEVLAGREGDFFELIAPAWVPGVGPKTQALLADMNITRLGQLRAFSPCELVRTFGRPGRRLVEALAPGEGGERIARCVAPQALLPGAEQAIEAEQTFAEPAAAPAVIEQHLVRAVAQCGQALRARRQETARLVLALVYYDGRRRCAGRALAPPAALDSALLAAAKGLLARLHTRRVCLVSLTLRCEGLCTAAAQLQLFVEPDVERERRRLCAVDTIRARYGIDAIGSGAGLLGRAG